MALVESIQGYIEHPQFSNVSQHFPIIQNTDDYTFGSHILIRRGNGQNRYTKSNQCTINVSLNEAILSGVSFKPIHVGRVVLNYG